MTKNTQKNSIWLPALFVVLSIPLSRADFFYYFAIAGLLFVGLLCNSFHLPIKDDFGAYPACMIAVWVFGMVVGILRHNPAEYLVRNFAGTVCYLFYYAIPFDVRQDKARFCRALVYSSVTATAFMCVASILYRRAGSAVWPFSSVEFNRYTRSVMSSVGVLAFVLEAAAVYMVLCEPSRRKKAVGAFLFCLSFYSAVIANTMGGYLLGFAAVLWLSVLGSIAHADKKDRQLAVLLLLLASVLIVLIDYSIHGFVYRIFSPEDAGNAKRLLQFHLVFERLKLFGNGLGAPFHYVFASRKYDTYSIEVSYLNCIDKYGILCLPVFAILIRSVYAPIRNIWRQRGAVLHNLIAVGLMAYLFISFGNPVLFAPYNVMIHCISLTLSGAFAEEGGAGH